MQVLPPAGMPPEETALRAWEAEANATGWNQPAILASLCWGSWGGYMGLGMFPWPLDEVMLANPLEALASIVRILPREETLRKLVRGPGTFHGVAFMYEAWSLIADADDQTAVQRANAVAARREVHQDPSRIEVRCVEAYTHEREWHFVRRRDAPLGELPVAAVDAMNGTIPRYLRQILALAT